MAILKKLFLLILIFVVIAFGGILYFVSQFSAVYPPIKKYDYAESYSQFLQDLKLYSTRHPEIIFSITDTTGGLNDGYSYYITIKTTSNNLKNEYHIAYETQDDWFGNKKNKIYLIGAFDRLKNLGGYKIKENGVKELVKVLKKT